MSKTIRKLIWVTFSVGDRAWYKFRAGKLDARGGGYTEGFYVYGFTLWLSMRFRNWEPGK